MYSAILKYIDKFLFQNRIAIKVIERILMLRKDEIRQKLLVHFVTNVIRNKWVLWSWDILHDCFSYRARSNWIGNLSNLSRRAEQLCYDLWTSNLPYLCSRNLHIRRPHLSNLSTNHCKIHSYHSGSFLRTIVE